MRGKVRRGGGGGGGARRVVGEQLVVRDGAEVPHLPSGPEEWEEWESPCPLLTHDSAEFTLRSYPLSRFLTARLASSVPREETAVGQACGDWPRWPASGPRPGARARAAEAHLDRRLLLCREHLLLLRDGLRGARNERRGLRSAAAGRAAAVGLPCVGWQGGWRCARGGARSAALGTPCASCPC